MTIALRAEVEPARWPADGLTDVAIRLVLGNQGDHEAAIFPKAAVLAERGGYGFVWRLQFHGAGGPVHQQELRRWHGPPGIPPSAASVKEHAQLFLAPGDSHESIIPACWIPSARLSPEHLDPLTLDPTGMDNIADHEVRRQWPESMRAAPPLSQRIPLGQASVLVYGQDAAHLEPMMASRPDFLRAEFATVVAFFLSAGEHRLEAAYVQTPWMNDLGDQLWAAAPPVTIRIG